MKRLALKYYAGLLGAVSILILTFLSYTNFSFFGRPYLSVRAVINGVSGYLIRGIEKPFRFLSHYYETYIDLVNTKKELISLKERMDRLYMENQRLKEIERENRVLKKILEVREGSTQKMIVASVIGEDVKNWNKGIILDKGTEHGISAGTPVISPSGLVGQVVESTSGSSKVMVINDPSSSVDVYVLGKDIRGIVQGTGYSVLKLKYVKKNEELETGDRLVTSGRDGVYPRGIPVGMVIRIERKSGGIFLDADVMPFANYRTLDYVMLLKR